MNTLLSGLKADGDEALQLQCLMELCEFLSIGTEETMSHFSVDQFVATLTNLLTLDHNPEIMHILSRYVHVFLSVLFLDLPVVHC